MKILIVDDMEINLELLEARLEGSGHEVISAKNGIEALEKLKRDSIDMIISDILMPKMDGFQLCRECKKDETLRNIHFVFYTATYTDKKDEEFALSLGAVRFIVKPMENKRFMEIIEDILKRHNKGLPPPPETLVEKDEAVYLKEYSERLVKKLNQKVFQLEESERALQNRTYDLGERVKELNCLYDISKLAEEQDVSLEEITQGIVNLIPPGWQYPEITCARVIMKGQEFRTENFRETIWKLASDIIVHGDRIGILEVLYLEEKPESDEGPFLKEEKDLIIAITERLGRITERKQAEEALRESEERFRSVVETANDAIVSSDARGNIISWNFGAETIFNYSSDEIVGQSLTFIMPERFRESHQKGMSRVISAGKSNYLGKTLETVGLRKDGSEFPLELSVATRKAGEETFFTGIMRDISERKQAAEKIKEYSKNLERMVKERTKELDRALYDTQEARDRIDGILKSVADGLIVTDLYNRVVSMNRAAEDLLGVRLSEVIDRPIDFAIDDKTLREKVKETLNKKTTGYEFDFELPGEDTEHPRIMRAWTSGVKDKKGDQTGIITIIHDVSHEREVDRMKTEFISTAAHELRTPLTSIQGFSEILLTRDDISGEEKKKFLSYINKQAVGLAMIVNDLLDISRIESGIGFSLNKVPCSVGDAISQIVLYFQEPSQKHHFEVVLPKEPVELLVDKEKMEQVLKNLISNAVKYSPDGGLIRVTGEISEDHYQVSVEDQGPGMTSEQVEKIFDKFYRVDASNSAIEGTGLGMTIVKYMVEAHGGKVWVESELEKGTTVRFTIPIG